MLPAQVQLTAYQILQGSNISPSPALVTLCASPQLHLDAAAVACRYTEGVSDLQGSSISLAGPPRQVVSATQTYAATWLPAQVQLTANQILQCSSISPSPALVTLCASPQLHLVAAAVACRYTEGVSDLQGSSISLAGPPQLLWGDASSGSEAGAAAQTWVNTLQVDRGVSFEVSFLQVNVCAFVLLCLVSAPLETVDAAWACRNSMARSTSRPATSFLESMLQHVQVAPLALHG
jgi:hypothetical protein